MPSVEDRVDNLERVLAEYIRNVGNAQMQTEKELRETHMQTEKELRKAHIQTEKELREFKEEMREFKGEMQEYKEEMREDRKGMNKKWGEIANKLGTVVEDIVAPNIPRIAQECFKCKDIDFFGIRITKRNSKDKYKRREFDVIAVCDDTVIINETKSSPKIEYVNEFAEVLKEINDYFPEYEGKKVIPIFSSLSIPENVVSYLTKMKIYAMVMKDDTMEILNQYFKLKS